MDFGRVDARELDTVDFSLPPLTERSAAVLARGKPGADWLHLGTPAWSKPQWVGKLYPKGWGTYCGRGPAQTPLR